LEREAYWREAVETFNGEGFIGERGGLMEVLVAEKGFVGEMGLLEKECTDLAVSF
jgi:hypothetical protein